MTMKTVRIKRDPLTPELPKGRVNQRTLDVTTDAQIAGQQREDDAVALQD